MNRYVYNYIYVFIYLYMFLCIITISVILSFYKRFIALYKRSELVLTQQSNKYKSPKYLCMIAELEFWDIVLTTASILGELR